MIESGLVEGRTRAQRGRDLGQAGGAPGPAASIFAKSDVDRPLANNLLRRTESRADLALGGCVKSSGDAGGATEPTTAHGHEAWVGSLALNGASFFRPSKVQNKV
jgi:hypothetical protein